MDKLEKAISRLNKKERAKILTLLKSIKDKDFERLDVKKLKGRRDLFRVRKGKLRIIFRISSKGDIFVLSLERCSDTIYNF